MWFQPAARRFRRALGLLRGRAAAQAPPWREVQGVWGPLGGGKNAHEARLEARLARGARALEAARLVALQVAAGEQ